MKNESEVIARAKGYEPLWNGWSFTGKRFGSGGAGCVLGLSRGGERSVVKVIFVENDPRTFNAVKNEIETMVTLHSDYLVECLNYRIEQVFNRKGELSGYDFLIHMHEYEPFSEFLREEDYNPEALCVQLTREIGTALGIFHRHGMLHRDIKPENIFIEHTDNGLRFRLGDFGVSKRISDMSGLTTTGTLDFMAPESFQRNEYSYSSDIYNLGMTLYYILNDLRFPVFAEEKSQSDFDYNINCRLRGDKLPAPTFGSNLLKKVVLKCCEANPKNRYKDVSELLNELFGQNIQRFGAKLPKEKTLAPPPKAVKRSKKPWIITASAAVLTAAIGILVWFFLLSHDSAPQTDKPHPTALPAVAQTAPAATEQDPKLLKYTVPFIDTQEAVIKKEAESTFNNLKSYWLDNSICYARILKDGGFAVQQSADSTIPNWSYLKYGIDYLFDKNGDLTYLCSRQKGETVRIYLYENDIIRVAVSGVDARTYNYGDPEIALKYQPMAENAKEVYTKLKPEIEKQENSSNE